MPNNNDLLLRQWTMLRMIPRYPRKITAKEVTERLSSEGFNVTKRTVERDLQGVSTTFPLLSDEREKPYGWSWAKDAPSFDLPGLTPSEALVFKLAQEYLVKLMPVSMIDQLSPYFNAADKTLNDTFHVSQLSNWQEKIAVAFPGQPLLAPNIDNNILSILESALLEERQVKVEYAATKELTPAHYIIHPLGIVLRGQVSYLVCTIFDYKDIRMLAVHRIKSAEKLVTTCGRPDQFSVHEYAKSSELGFGDDGMIYMSLKFNAEAGKHLYETPINATQSITELETGAIIVEAHIANNAQLRWWILSFGDQVEVLEPPSVLQFMIDTAKTLSQRYRIV